MKSALGASCAVEVNLPIPREIVPQLHRADNMLFRYASRINSQNDVEEITITHGWILCYLNDNRNRNIYQKDIEHTFSVVGSTVTNILQRMEKKGYIRRESVANDARLKRLLLTEEGFAAYEKISHSLQVQKTQVESLLTPKEQEEFLRLLAKIQVGLSQA
jgi:DNA-binding MarR family transcriptional regulator